MSKYIGLSIAAVAIASVTTASAASHTEAMPSSSGVKSEILMWMQDAEEKLIALAEVMPEGKYKWQPDKGVRTLGEVFMHVATANYGLPSFVGVAAPQGFDFRTYEHSRTKKADIVKSLKDSFAHVRNSLEATTNDDMSKPAEFFGLKTTTRGAYLLLLSHAHEHLGQAIAYARSNKITPPWTAKEQAAEAKQKKY